MKSLVVWPWLYTIGV